MGGFRTIFCTSLLNLHLQLALTDLNVGESVKVPYRFFSENSIRATASQLKADKAVEFDINTRSNVAAVLTRTQ